MEIEKVPMAEGDATKEPLFCISIMRNSLRMKTFMALILNAISYLWNGNFCYVPLNTLPTESKKAMQRLVWSSVDSARSGQPIVKNAEPYGRIRKSIHGILYPGKVRADEVTGFGVNVSIANNAAASLNHLKHVDEMQSLMNCLVAMYDSSAIVREIINSGWPPGLRTVETFCDWDFQFVDRNVQCMQILLPRSWFDTGISDCLLRDVDVEADEKEEEDAE